MNAMNLEMFEGIGRAMAEFDADHDLRCVMFRGRRQGFRGGDISEFAAKRSTVTRRLPMRRSRTRRWRRCRLPPSDGGGDRGACVGGGLWSGGDV